MTKRIPIVDDEKLGRWPPRKNLVGFGREVLDVEGGREGLGEKGGVGARSDATTGQVYTRD